MDPISATESIKKHGVVSVLTIFIFLMYNFFSNRLDKVEEKLERVESNLYDCLNDKAQVIHSELIQRKYIYEHPVLAILPEKLKIKCLS
jgi:hypothetical protein